MDDRKVLVTNISPQLQVHPRFYGIFQRARFPIGTYNLALCAGGPLTRALRMLWSDQPDGAKLPIGSLHRHLCQR